MQSEFLRVIVLILEQGCCKVGIILARRVPKQRFKALACRSSLVISSSACHRVEMFSKFFEHFDPSFEFIFPGVGNSRLA